MKGFLLIALVAMLAAFATANVCDSICPDEYPVTVDRNLPVSNDCEHFCHCANDGNHYMICPLMNTLGDRLHFNPTLSVCDWPSAAGCDGDGNGTITDPDCPIACEPDQCLDYPHANDCNLFCRCSNGDLSVVECPSGLHFNPSLNMCDRVENAGCEEGPIVTPTPPPPSGNVCDDICPNEWPVTVNRHLPIPDDCTHFCHCANDGNWLKACPPMNTAGDLLHFNAALEVCDWPWAAGCDPNASTKPTPPPPTTTTTESSGGGGGGDDVCADICPDEWPVTENRHLAVPGNCTVFCHCANDGAHLKDCPYMANGERLHFNQKLEVCDWPYAAGCPWA